MTLLPAIILGMIGRFALGRGREPGDPWYLAMWDRWVSVMCLYISAAVAVWPETWQQALAVALCGIHYTMGHGSYFDFGQSGKPDNELSGKIFLFWWHDNGSNSWRDFVGMTIRYTVYILPVFALINPWSMVLAPVLGLSIALGYYAAFVLQPSHNIGRIKLTYTGYGELGIGAFTALFLWIGAAI